MSTLNYVLDDWYQRVVVTQSAHYLSAQYFANRSYWLGVPVIGLTTFVGTSVFATMQRHEQDIRLQIVVGLASVLASVLASLQTFLGYAQRAEKHRIAGAKYGALGRELEVLRASATPTAAAIDDLRKRMEAMALESPNNPARIYDQAALEHRSASTGPK